MALSAKHAAFVAAYLANGFNARQAAIAAGYGERGAAGRGRVLLAVPAIAEAVKAELDARRLGADAVLSRLAEHATASLDDFLSDGPTPAIDIARARRRGVLHLARRVRTTTRRDRRGGEIITAEIELVDAQAALVHIGRAHKLFTDRVQLDDWRADALRAGLAPEQVNKIFEDATAAIVAVLAEVGHDGTSNDAGNTGND